MNNVEFNINEEDVWLLFCAAFRYALGRRSYMPSTIASVIVANRHLLTEWQRKQLCQEVDEYKADCGCLGDKCDEETWQRFKQQLC